MAKTPEGEVVEYAKKQLKAKGCLVRKISYEMRRGCPDLMVLVPERDVPFWGYRSEQVLLPEHVLFLEIKKDEQTKPDPHQQREHERMRAVGADVRTIGSKAQVDELIEELFPCD
jgi:hypothetical protein